MRLGAYGDETAPRPIVEVVGGKELHVTPGYRSDPIVRNVAFTDVHFLASERLAAAPVGRTEPLIHLVAVEWRGQGAPFRTILFENLKLQGLGGGNSSVQDVQDLRVRRNVFVDLFNPGGQGTYCSAVLSCANGLLLEENVFCRIQHVDTHGVSAISHFSHSAYIGAEA